MMIIECVNVVSPRIAAYIWRVSSARFDDQAVEGFATAGYIHVAGIFKMYLACEHTLQYFEV